MEYAKEYPWEDFTDDICNMRQKLQKLVDEIDTCAVPQDDRDTEILGNTVERLYAAIGKLRAVEIDFAP